MPTVNEILTQYNSANFHGRLHYLTPEDTPFATLAGGFADGGGQVAFHNTFEWQTTDLRSASATAQVVDAADAPAAENRVRENVFNVIETHTDTVGVGFERMGQTQQFSGQNIGQDANPVTDELPWQINQMWKQIKRDGENSLLHGSYQLPADNVTPARTRGIIEAITTNVVSGREDAQDTTADNVANTFTTVGHGYSDGDTVYLGGDTAPTGITFGQAYFIVNSDADTFQVSETSGGSAVTFSDNGAGVTVARGKSLDDYLVEYAMQDAYDAGGLQEGDTRILMVPSVQKMQLSDQLRRRGIEVRSNRVLGVNVMQIETSFGPLSVVLNRHLNDGSALALSFEQIQLWHRLVPAHDNVPGGISFAYPKARDGNRSEYVLYTSLGLEYGSEQAHAKIEDLSVTRPAS